MINKSKKSFIFDLLTKYSLKKIQFSLKTYQSKVVSQWELLWDTGQLTRYFVCNFE